MNKLLVMLLLLAGCETGVDECPLEGCRSEGLCTRTESSCIAKKQDCEGSWACIDEGRCHAIGGWCEK